MRYDMPSCNYEVDVLENIFIILLKSNLPKGLKLILKHNWVCMRLD